MRITIETGTSYTYVATISRTTSVAAESTATGESEISSVQNSSTTTAASTASAAFPQATSAASANAAVSGVASKTVGKGLSAGDTSFQDILNAVARELAEKKTAASKTSASAASSASSASSGENLDAYFTEAAETYGVDKKLLLAMAKQESRFKTDVVSSAGAMGVMQLMPETAKYLGVTDPFDAKQNIMGGAKYIRQKLDEFNGDVTLALAAYSAGSGAVKKYGGVPPYAETQNHIKKVMEFYNDPTLAAPGASADS